jgi:hypothetical protein
VAKKSDFDTRQEQETILSTKTSTPFKEIPSFSSAVSNKGSILADKAEDENTKTKSIKCNMSWKMTSGKTTAKTGRHL